jgi:TetR/AcrR family transcriptional regulator, mexJK operon transcriptional repressor
MKIERCMKEIRMPNPQGSTRKIPERDGQARQRIVQAGRRLFFTQGFKNISTDMLAKEAAVSKATLYKYFSSMASVLQAVVEAEVEIFEHGVPGDVSSRTGFELALVRYGTNLLGFLNKAETIQFTQLMFEEARLHPAIANTFYTAAYARTLKDLTRIMGHGLDQGFLDSELTAEELAEQLLGMWEGFRFVRAQLGLTKKPFKNPQSWVERGVETLMGSRVSQKPAT